MLRRIEPCCATGTNVPVWLSSSRTLLTESDSLRGCYELGPERLTNAENRARRRTDLTEKAAFPCGLFAEFITLSSSLPTNTLSATDVNDALHICSGTAVKWPQDDPLITSDRSDVAGVCLGLQMPHI